MPQKLSELIEESKHSLVARTAMLAAICEALLENRQVRQNPLAHPYEIQESESNLAKVCKEQGVEL